MSNEVLERQRRGVSTSEDEHFHGHPARVENAPPLGGGEPCPRPCKPEESKAEQTGKARWCMPRSQTAGELHKTTLNRILTLSQQGGASASVV